jgi:DNA-binding NarL/FixJ family response regulator
VLATFDVPTSARSSSSPTRSGASIASAAASAARSAHGATAARPRGGALPALDSALRALFAPLEYPDLRSWLDAAREAVRELTGVEVVVPPCVLDSPAGWDAVERAVRGAVLAEAGISRDGMHHEAIVRAVLPAIRAGFAAWRQLAARRAELTAMLDSLPESVLLFDAAGELAHANPKGTQLVTEAHAEVGARVRAEAQRMAWSVGATARRAASAARGSAPSDAPPATPVAIVREVRAGCRVIRLRATVAPAWMLGGEPGVLVTATVDSAAPLTDGDLRERFGLTAREIQVARLLGAGLSNQEIAEQLGVSYFTARNHVERLLAKLGLGSRTRVGPLLRNEAA